MASVQAVQHKEKMAKAYATMEEIFGWPRKSLTPILNNLLKIYNNEWDFIEAENYRVLADNYLEAQEAQNSSRGGGPVTRARRAHSGSDTYDNSDDSPSPPRGSPHPGNALPPPTRAAINGGNNARSDALVPVKREPNSPASGRAADALPPVNVLAQAMEYHSGSSVRTRAASQNGSPGTRGRMVPHNSAAAAAAHQREKGKSPLVSESRRPQPSGVKGLPDHVTVKLEVSSSLPAPEGFEKVAFEKVDGVILPAVRRAQNGAVEPLKQAEQLAPLTSRVKIECETVHQQSDPKNQILVPTPLLAKDPNRNMNIHIKTEPQEKNFSPPDHNYVTCEDVILDQSVQRELSLEETVQLSPGHLQMVPYGTIFADGPSTGPSVDQAPKVELEEQERTVLPMHQSPEDGNGGLEEQDGTVLPVDRAQEHGNVELEDQERTVLPVDRSPEDGNVELQEQERTVLPVDRSPADGNVLSLVDYEDDDPMELAEQGTPGTGCDVVLIPDEPSEQVEPPELNDEEIRPNFIVSGNAKRDMVNEQVAGHTKRQKCEASVPPKATSSTAPPRRRLILDESPATPMNGDSDLTILGHVTGPSSTAGVKRKLIISASPSPEGSGGISKDVGASDGVDTIVRNGDTLDLVPDRCEEKVKVVLEARGQGSMNSALKRVKLEPGVEDRNGQQLKHDPRDISRGTERVPIPFVNEFTSETINKKFNYIPSNVVYQNAYINISLARIGDEDFCLDCVGDCLKAPHSCPCTRETGGEFAYTQDGRLKPAFVQDEVETNHDLRQNLVFCSSGWLCPIERARTDTPDKCKGHPVRKFVKECWHKCGCNMRCGNRLVQRGISRRLEVFFTNDGKGWGLRTAEDLPIGSFVCEYVGEIMTNTELDQRNQESKKVDACRQAGKQKDTYPLLLDGDWCSENRLQDEDALCLDATRYGNVARFINHRCVDATLIDIPVSIEGLDRHYYHVAFFTSRDVHAGEELTWDYKIDFEDDEHPIEAFHCLCKSELCRGGRASGTKKHKK